MEFGNDGVSLYHKIGALYARSNDGVLLFISGKKSEELESSWSRIRQDVTFGPCKNTTPTELKDNIQHDDVSGYDIYEFKRSTDTFVVGLFVEPLSQEHTTQNNALLIRFLFQMMQRSQLYILNEKLVSEEKGVADAVAITELFSNTLRNIPKVDEWEPKGRKFFQSRVLTYTKRSATVEMVLPAFPCKSSNTDKVSGTDPDKGEELALREMEKFAAAVEKVYEPGCKIWIVSDGHVFSDCIGVNDEEVDRYGDVLQKMYAEIKAETSSGRDRVGFQGLADCFGLDYVSPLLIPADVATVESKHEIQTDLTTEAEFCRKLLMLGFQIDGASLRSRIEGGDKAMVSLYRGFSRFMLEDLALHPRLKGMSKSATKKLASKAAFEMIKRNQAYSNLVEMVFPMHVRLSIHAHSNAGPKFGIRTLPKDECRTLESLFNADLANSADLLHIPTPWHNSICRIDGDKYWYVTKSRAIKDVLAAGTYTGAFEQGSGSQGGYFRLTKVAQISESQPEKVADVSTQDAKIEAGPSKAFTGGVSAADIVLEKPRNKSDKPDSIIKIVLTLGSKVGSTERKRYASDSALAQWLRYLLPQFMVSYCRRWGLVV